MHPGGLAYYAVVFLKSRLPFGGLFLHPGMGENLTYIH
jgi:hypothetical protein